MNKRLNSWNRLLQVALLVLLLPVGLVHSQSELPEDMSYDWSTFLLLVIPVLIILVVLVLCVTGVFMFCLSTLTMSYDQDCAGHTLGSNNPTPEVKKTLFGLQLCSDKDWLDQGLPVSDAVKCAVDEEKECCEDSGVIERTSVDLTEEVESENNERNLVTDIQGISKLKEVAIDIESTTEQEKSVYPPAPSDISPILRELHHFTKQDCSLPQTAVIFPTQVHSKLPTLQQLSLQYFRPQDALRSLEVRG